MNKKEEHNDKNDKVDTARSDQDDEMYRRLGMQTSNLLGNYGLFSLVMVAKGLNMNAPQDNGLMFNH